MCILSCKHFGNALKVHDESFDLKKFSIDVYAIEAKCVNCEGIIGFKFEVDVNPPKIEARIKEFKAMIY